MEKTAVTRKDIHQCLAMVFLTVFFSVRGGGEFWEAAFITIRHVAAYFVYGFALVFIFIGMLKKADMLEKFCGKKPGKSHFFKWSLGVAAFLAVYQMLYELLLVLLA